MAAEQRPSLNGEEQVWYKAPGDGVGEGQGALGRQVGPSPAPEECWAAQSRRWGPVPECQGAGEGGGGAGGGGRQGGQPAVKRQV